MKVTVLIGAFALLSIGAFAATKSGVVANWSFAAPSVSDRDAIDPKTAGDIVFDTNLGFSGWDGSGWVEFGGSPSAYWRVDANISGANPSLGSSDQNAYVGIENGSLTLTNNSASDVLTAQIPCSSTNSPSGTTCSAGNESVGVAFTIPSAGSALACVSGGSEMSTGAGGDINAAFQVVETACNSQTIIQEGKSRIPMQDRSASSVVNQPFRICGTFVFSTSGQKCLRLMYEQDTTGTINSNIILADAVSTVGQRDIHWEVYPLR